MRLLSGIALAIGIWAPLAGSLGPDWIELFRATFTGVSDSTGDGKSFPSEVGKLTTIAPPGKSFQDVAPKSGVFSENLFLTDTCGATSCDFGVRATPTADALKGVFVGFYYRQEGDSCAFGADVTDGVTVEFASIDIDDGKVVVNGRALKTKVRSGATYRIYFNLYENGSAADTWDFSITNLDTGDSEFITDVLVPGFRPVHGVDFHKKAGRPSTFHLDSISIFGLQK